MSKVQSVISRIVSDAKFRQALMEDSAGAFQSVGVEPSAEMLQAFEGLDQETMKELTLDINLVC